VKKNVFESGRLQMTIGSMHIALWVTKAANTHAEYLILNDFALHQELHDRIPVLRCTHIACFALISC
jgi:hypothetical protein